MHFCSRVNTSRCHGSRIFCSKLENGLGIQNGVALEIRRLNEGRIITNPIILNYLLTIRVFYVERSMQVHEEASCIKSRNFGYFITAPNIFHIGVEESVSVIIYDAKRPVAVTIVAQDFPNKQRNLTEVSGVFTSEKPGILKLKLNPKDFPVDVVDDEDVTIGKRFVYLVAKSNHSDMTISKHVKVLVSFLDGIVLLQTDKPIYTPRQSYTMGYTSVKIRIIPLGFELRPNAQKKVTVVVKNPQGIVVQRWKDLITDTGFITKTFGLSEFALIGNWTILAFHGHKNTQNTSVKFEVKEYVLPKFYVDIKGPSYVLPNAKIIDILIQSRYTYGKPVQGRAVVKVSLVRQHSRAIQLGITTKPLVDGKAHFIFDTENIRNVPGVPWFPDSRRLQVEADVIEKTSGKKESAIDNGIYFVKSPYKIDRKETAEYFKPALPFVVKVNLMYPDKTAAQGVPMSITVTGTTLVGNEVQIGSGASKRDDINLEDVTDSHGRAEFVVDTPGNIRSMKIKVETENNDLLEDQNTFIELDVQAYKSPSKTFLHVRAMRDDDHINCDVFMNRNASKITFVIIARGKIIYQWVKVQAVGVISSFRFRILPEMVPSSRLVAFFFTEDGEVVADSSLLKINNGLLNKVTFHTKSDGKPEEELPGTQYKIQLSATPGTRVGLLAVDQSVYLVRNREKLNQKKVLKIMDAMDLGCGVGSGSDSEDVLYKAGILVLTNANVVGRPRSEFGCHNSGSRKKRSAQDNKDLDHCCKKGFLPTRASCVLRVRYLMVDFSEICKTEFLRCCFNFTGEKPPLTTEVRSRKVHQANQDLEDDEILQGQLRSYFPETWVFMEGVVGDNGKFHLYATLPDTISTWVIQAVGISNETGLGIARPLNVQASKDFFVSLRLPYSVQRGEQISVIATVFNYAVFNLKVKVMLAESDDFCSNAPAGQSSPSMVVTVEGNDAKSVSFPIIPIKLGKVVVRVSCAAQLLQDGLPSQYVASDIVQRNILVVPEGLERRVTHSVVLDPLGILRDEKPNAVNSSNATVGIKHDRVVHKGMQVDNVFLSVPARAIPGSLSASLSLTGNLIGPVVTNLMSGGLESLLRMPVGCGEQTMVFLAPNVYVLEYLLTTRQVTDDIESRAYTMIQSGYQRALNYRRKDTSFSAFGESRPGSTWLTAFAMKVFCAAQRFDGIQIDEALVCDSVMWLLENQRDDGAFPEVKNIIHQSMMGGTHGSVAMTAFVLVSLLECGCHGQNKSLKIQKAVGFLELELHSIHRVNILALATYALALAGSKESSQANTKLLQQQIFEKDKATRYWNAGSDAMNVETTAYALLAQMEIGRLKFAGPIVTWLTSKRTAQGGFISTQDTCVALQALSKYSEKTVGATLDLRVSISSEKDPNWIRKYHVSPSNALILRRDDITQLLGGQVFIDSVGSGIGQLQIEIHHNVPSSKNETCRFSLRIETRELIKDDDNDDDDDAVKTDGRSRDKRDDDERQRKAGKCRKKSCRRNKKNKKHRKRPKTEAKLPDALHIKICTKYLKPGKTGMTIMEVGVFSGFTPDENSLIELMENVRPTIDRYEVSDRSVIFYVSEISSVDEFCAKFKMNRIFNVGTVQPVPVKVYDYYTPADSCVEFYSPNPKSPLLLGICEEGQCRCSQDDCAPCEGQSLKLHELVRKACEEFDFAVKAEVALVDELEARKQSWLTYAVKLKRIIKRGRSHFRRGDLIEFKKRGGCKCPDLLVGKEYIFMAKEEGSMFVLDARSLVLPWEKRRKNNLLLEDLRARVASDRRCRM